MRTLLTKGPYRIIAEQDYHLDLESLKGDCFDPEATGMDPKELKSLETEYESNIESYGVFLLALEKWNPNIGCGWEQVDIISGIEGWDIVSGRTETINFKDNDFYQEFLSIIDSDPETKEFEVARKALRDLNTQKLGLWLHNNEFINDTLLPELLHRANGNKEQAAELLRDCFKQGDRCYIADLLGKEWRYFKSDNIDLDNVDFEELF